MATALARRLKRYGIRLWWYWTGGVWNDTRSNWRVDFVKTVNLAVRSILDTNMQQKAAALTFNTMLALVPTLAMLFAIGRGFGFQNIVESEVFNLMPVQRNELSQVLSAVDSYLEQSSEGLFVGIGILFLLWTLISLLSNVEDAFNHIWGISIKRNFYRKVTDYIAICFIIPVLIICTNGIKLFVLTMSSDTFLSPVVEVLLDVAPILLTWMAFTLAFVLIPYTKVKPRYATISGLLCAIAFMTLQWLMVTGQLYVSRYNAIYGSFAFLPILLMWIYMSWLVCLSGAVLTYSAQNIFRFNFRDNINEISQRYMTDVTIVLLAIVVKRFALQRQPYTKLDITERYDIPARLTGVVIDHLVEVRLLSRVVGKDDREEAYQPAFDIGSLTLRAAKERLRNSGKSGFIASLQERFEPTMRLIHRSYGNTMDEVLIKDLPINFNETEI